MTDMRVNAPRSRGARQDRLEYRLYFALIFLFALPTAMVACVAHYARHRTRCQGPVARAVEEARRLAPMIFHG
jgi:hypothetical protein